MGSTAGLLRPLGQSSLTGPVGPHRAWSTAHVTLSDVKAIRAAVGGTVNDVVLTLVSGGLRELLQSRGENVEGRVSGPWSRCRSAGRASGAHTTTGSPRCSPSCPWASEDPVARLQPVRAQMDKSQAVRAGGGRRGADLAVGLCASDTARARRPAGGPVAVARRSDRGDQRPRPAAPAPDARAAAARIVPVRPPDRQRANLDRDLLLQRRALLRRHRGLRQLGDIDVLTAGVEAWTGRTAQDEPAAGTRTGIQAGKAEVQGPRRGVSRRAANPACVMPSGLISRSAGRICGGPGLRGPTCPTAPN